MCFHQADADATRIEATALEIMYIIYNHLFFVAMQLFLSTSNQSNKFDHLHQHVLPFSVSKVRPMKCLDNIFLKLTVLTSALIKGGKC
jgi:hypothetical protein